MKIAGVPRAILGDHGGDLHGGVTRFCESHPNTTSLYDMTYKAATLLNARLNMDNALGPRDLLLGITV